MNKHLISLIAALSFCVAAPSAFAVPAAVTAPGVPASSIGVANGVAPTDSNAKIAASQIYPTTGYRFIGQNSFIGAEQGFTPILGGNGETTRVTYNEPFDIWSLKLFFPTQTAVSGLEVNLPNPVFYYGSTEYSPSGASSALTAPDFFTLAGQTSMLVGTQGSGVTTEAQGIFIPSGSTFSVRLGTYVTRHPASVSAAATSGGSLFVGTYYYEVTAVANGVESSPSNEISVATTSGNQTVTLTLVAPVGSQPVYQTYKIYRGLTSGSEAYLGSLSVPGLTFIDNGSIPTTVATPPSSAYHTYALNDTVEGANNSGVPASTNALYAGGGDAYQVGGVGALGEVGPNAGLISRPYLLGQTASGFSTMLLADSIGAGYNILPGSTALGTTALYDSWFGLAMSGSGNNDYINASLPSTTCNSMLSNGQYGSNVRWNLMQYAQYVWIALGTNDIYGGTSTGVQTASCILKVAQLAHETGRRVIVSNLIPRVATTDHMLTLANESIANSTYESYRVFVNTWMRNGFQVLAGVPVTSGGASCTCIYKGFDEAQAAGEVNSAGVPTVNGGFLPVPTTALYTGQVLTGTPTTTSLTIGAASYAAHTLSNRVVQITSGSTSGQTAVISDNTSTTLTISGLTSAPAAGAAVSIWATHWSDGIHPTDLGHADIAAGLNGNMGATAFAASNLVGF
jgi:lysophospholipase L1-like esterase